MAHGTKYSQEELERMAAEHEAASDEPTNEDEWTYDDGSSEQGTGTITVRLPRSAIAALKREAIAADVGATVVARRWLLERLSQGGGRPGERMVIDADELLEWVALRRTARLETGPSAMLRNFTAAGRLMLNDVPVVQFGSESELVETFIQERMAAGRGGFVLLRLAGAEPEPQHEPQ
jgi:hypothetical protein